MLQYSAYNPVSRPAAQQRAQTPAVPASAVQAAAGQPAGTPTSARGNPFKRDSRFETDVRRSSALRTYPKLPSLSDDEDLTAHDTWEEDGDAAPELPG